MNKSPRVRFRAGIARRIVRPVAVVVGLLALCAHLIAEDAPAGDTGPAKEVAKIGTPSPALSASGAGTPPTNFVLASGAGTSSCETSTAKVQDGKLKVSAAGDDLEFEYQSISWGGKATTLDKAAPTCDKTTASTSRGGGLVETISAKEVGFENTLLIPSRSGTGDLRLKGVITTKLKVERTFPGDPLADDFQTDGFLTFLNGSGNRVLQLSATQVVDAAGASMVAMVNYKTMKSGYAFEVVVPEKWLDGAKFPINVDPLIGSPAALAGVISGKDQNESSSAFGSSVYLVAVAFGDAWNKNDLYGRFVNADGSLGGPIPIASGTIDQRKPRVAYSPSSGGVFGVAFQEGNNAIFKLYSPTGTLQGTYTVNNSATCSTVQSISVAADSSGNFLVCFTGYVGTSPPKLWGERRSATGSLLTDDTELAAGTAYGEFMANSDVVWNSTMSEWFVTWQKTTSDLRARGWNSSLSSSTTSEVVVATNLLANDVPRVCWNSADNQYLCVFAATDYCVKGQKLGADNADLIGSAFSIATGYSYAPANRPSVAFSPVATRFIVCYTKYATTTTGGIACQLVSRSGGLIYTPFTVDDSTGIVEDRSAISYNPANDEQLATWQDKQSWASEKIVSYVRMEITPPAVPVVTASNLPASHRITLTWPKTSESDLYGYHVLRATTAGGPYGTPVFIAAPGGSTVSYNDDTVSQNVRYYYVVDSVDTHGNPSDYSAEVSEIIDTILPAVPSGLAGTAGDSQVSLTWTANSEPDLAGYNVYSKPTGDPTWVKKNAALVATPSFVVTGLTNGISYDFAVTAVDTEPNESAKCTPITVAAGDTTPPAAPVGLSGDPADSSVSLSWTANSEPDLAGYNAFYRVSSPPGAWIKKNATLIGGTTFVVTGLTNGVLYDFAVSAVDTSANESPKSATVSATPGDSVPPAAPTGLAGVPGDTIVDLTWTPNAEGDLAGYNVYYRVTGDTAWIQKNGALVGSPSYSVTGLANWLSYDFAVSAKDTSGNESTKSTSITKAPDGPISPPSLDASNERKTNDSTPAITGSSTRGWTVTLYQGTLAIGSGLVDATGHFNISTDELSEGSHIIQAKATPPSPGAPTSGLSSGRVVTIDVTPPATPTGLSVLFGDSFADLRWDANTEADLLGYNIYRREPSVSDWTKVNDKPVTGERYLDESVVNSHTYEYRITAVDDTLDEN